MPVASARHILVKSKEEAEQLKDRIAKGEDFAALAKKHSLCPSGKQGGDLGEFRPGMMVKPFDDVVFKEAVLEVHGPVKTQFGFHLVQTLYRR
ncbi:peptidylprolyl isomerase [Pokkaliibacter plantistimulans]|uniref:Peptidyl-prolyl cis-trans isomerase C n=2 Tax=Pseudomonadota TaxID=1224 RepID=A0ABX5LY60_9GAMM|nr:peptidylprolyl isomerase [Pokkaliibacter plantistimulans]PPC78977.1 peptidylprolyl isomerase [Pokkaliibacter plantistimulans]PXF30393.1 peptidylprolyl isomerase [Pokkaliibacter plantistimulans]